MASPASRYATILTMPCRLQKTLNSPLLSLPLPAVSVSRRVPCCQWQSKAPGTQSPRADLTPTGPLCPAACSSPAWPRPGWLRSPALGVGSPRPLADKGVAWDQCCGPPAWQVHSNARTRHSTEPEAGPALGRPVRWGHGEEQGHSTTEEEGRRA